MEFNFELRRLLILAALLAGFALIGGFTRPDLPPESLHHSQRVYKAWFYCMALFVSGSACVTLIDHWTGTLEPVNLRFAYIALGAILMAAGLLWGRVIRQTTETPPQKVVQQTSRSQETRPNPMNFAC